MQHGPELIPSRVWKRRLPGEGSCGRVVRTGGEDRVERVSLHGRARRDLFEPDFSEEDDAQTGRGLARAKLEIVCNDDERWLLRVPQKFLPPTRANLCTDVRRKGRT